MIPNPIRKVLSTLSTHEVRYLLMGGQACVLYGAAEFSRDCDIAILCEDENIGRLKAALAELDAVPIAMPPFEAAYLLRGHAVHFRCRAPQSADIRVDVMANMRGVAPFDDLWCRRTTLTDDAGFRFEMMALDDLILAKKTQRDKDWPMIRRLVEAHYAAHQSDDSEERVRFWLRESRTPDLLIQLAARHPEAAAEVASSRPLLQIAMNGERNRLAIALTDEEFQERKTDRDYWEPLKRELEQLRRDRRQG